MGSESGIAVAGEFRELFDELGLPDGQVVLIQLSRAGGDAYGPLTPTEMPLGNPILDDPADRETFAAFMSTDRRIWRIWGGNLAPDEATLADGLIAEGNLKSAMTPRGGGIQYDGKILPIIDYQRGFSVEAAVMQWYVITESIRLTE